MFHLISKHFRLIFFWAVLLGLVVGVASYFLPQKYSSESQVLLISRSYGSTDPYTQAKAAERIGENLSQVLKTVDFYNKVMEMPTAEFDKARWENWTERRRRKTWQRDVQAEVVYGTGLLRIKVYSHNQVDTLAFSQAVTETVASRGWEYVGGDVIIKVVNGPLVSLWPARPNYFLNIFLGFILGAILSALWVIRYRKHKAFGIL